MRSLRQYVFLMAVGCAALAARATIVTNTIVETSSSENYHYQSTLEQFKGLDIAVDKMYPGWRVVVHHFGGAGFVAGTTEFPAVSYLDFRDRKLSVEFPGAKDFYARFNWVEKYTTEEMAYYNGWLHFKEEDDGKLTLVESQMETVPGYRVPLPKVETKPEDPKIPDFDGHVAEETYFDPVKCGSGACELKVTLGEIALWVGLKFYDENCDGYAAPFWRMNVQQDADWTNPCRMMFVMCGERICKNDLQDASVWHSAEEVHLGDEGVRDFYLAVLWTEKSTGKSKIGWLHMRGEPGPHATVVHSYVTDADSVVVGELPEEGSAARSSWNFEDADPLSGIETDSKWGLEECDVLDGIGGHYLRVDVVNTIRFPCEQRIDTNTLEVAFRYMCVRPGEDPPMLERDVKSDLGQGRLSIVCVPGLEARIDGRLSFGLCQRENPDWSTSYFFMLTTIAGSYELSGVQGYPSDWYDVKLRLHDGRAVVIVNDTILSSEGRTDFPVGDGPTVGWFGLLGYGGVDDITIRQLRQPIGFGGLGVEVPGSWARKYPLFTQRFGYDLNAALLKPTGKRSASGEPLCVWHDFVMGTDPTDTNDVFKVSLRMYKGEPELEWYPDEPGFQALRRSYTIFGKKNLDDANWSVADLNDLTTWRFFKVGVSIGEEGKK